MLMKGFVVVLVAVVLAAATYTFFMKENQGAQSGEVLEPTSGELALETGVTHNMVLGPDGYEPRNIDIAVGDKIVFSTTEDNPYWPASNVHPTHRIYSEFDPKEPVKPEDTWEFVFTKEGEWRYHDHLAPFYTGVITVKK